ncbi:MAG TPA: holo-ACP synthase [Candidatus Acidoferrum sp.]|nr:holo-ACP synthase [Candidatus Acidoferrum sp.]
MITLLPVRIPIPRVLAEPGCNAGVPETTAATDPRIGVDLIAVARVREVFEGRETLLEAVFTAEELRYCTGQKDPFMHLAARYAAKEATVKGLGTGVTGEMAWRDVETVHGPLGEPCLVLHGEAARIAGVRGLHRCAVSLSHSGDYAMAAVLLSA